jgi:ABC-type glutathione transport system ATPase component
MTDAAVLDARDVHVQYGRRHRVTAVAGVSVSVAPGETVALVGESGCGKSSFARAVVGIEPLAGGEITVHGRLAAPLRGRSAAARRAATDVQMVFQDPNSSLNPRRRIQDQLEDGIAAARARGADVQTPAELIASVGLPVDALRRYPHQFSGGQKQRIAIARALAARPTLLVADEPISALDASTQTTIAALMRDLTVAAGAGLLFISHDLAVVRRVADRVLVMYGGRIVEHGPTERVWQHPEHPYTRALLSAIPEPDGRGVLPHAPSATERAAWLDA